MMETGEGHLRRFAAALPERRKTRILEYLGALGRDVSAFSEALKIIDAPRAGLSPLVNGHDLSRETGLPPGPRLGMLKGWLYRRQVEDDLVTFECGERLHERVGDTRCNLSRSDFTEQCLCNRGLPKRCTNYY